MKITQDAIVVLGAALALAGCGKQSALEGKITNARGQPLAEIKVIADQTNPVKGYEHFETTTGPDGVFRFSKLHPMSEYTLIPVSERWLTEERRVKVDSAADGQSKTLTEAISFRYQQSAEGIITDSKGGLDWFVGTAEAKSWEEARAWVASLTLGGGWRMPASEELKTIQTGAGKKQVFDPVFKIENCVWPVEQKTSRVWVEGTPYYGPRYYGPGYYGPGYYGRGYYEGRSGYWATQGKGGKCRGMAVRAAKS